MRLLNNKQISLFLQFPPTAATAALRRKKVTEQELDRLQNTRFQLEMQVNTLESASFNAENMAAMKKAAGALKDIHGHLYVLTLIPTSLSCERPTLSPMCNVVVPSL